MITVLMSVYSRERPEFLSTALSSLVNQTEHPDEILLIKDGPLNQELEQVIEKYTPKLGLRTIQLPENRGLAHALNAGLAAASNDWIIRFDTDDYCCPNRIARQRALALSGQFDLFGSQIEEFVASPSETVRSRIVPCNHDRLVEFGKKRNPFNHMTVCYRKSLALDCGGYPDIRFMEDYGLWIKMIAAGARISNDTEILVKARVGNGMAKRRGGLGYVGSEIKLQELMVHVGYKSLPEAVRDGTIRSLIFVLPIGIRRLVYQLFLRS